MTISLGRLEKVSLRDFFLDEAKDFTPWLAKEENIELLGESLGLDIEVEDTEVRIGKFSADIVAIDRNSNRTIIIENQLEKTNHDHLGKIVTYASGKDANIVIWICKKLQNEHRKGLDWLNDISTEEFAFFGIEMELFKIDKSRAAPLFNIVVSPNDWSKSLKSLTGSKTLSETKLLQQEFWSSLNDYLTENDTFLSIRSPRPQHWQTFSVGRSYFNLALTVNTQKNKLGCELYIRGENAKEWFNQIIKQKEEIENKIGEELNWMELPQGQDCRIVIYTNCNIKEKESWENIFEWCYTMVESFHKAFSPIIKSL